MKTILTLYNLKRMSFKAEKKLSHLPFCSSLPPPPSPTWRPPEGRWENRSLPPFLDQAAGLRMRQGRRWELQPSVPFAGQPAAKAALAGADRPLPAGCQPASPRCGFCRLGRRPEWRQCARIRRLAGRSAIPHIPGKNNTPAGREKGASVPGEGGGGRWPTPSAPSDGERPEDARAGVSPPPPPGFLAR